MVGDVTPSVAHLRIRASAPSSLLSRFPVSVTSANVISQETFCRLRHVSAQLDCNSLHMCLLSASCHPAQSLFVGPALTRQRTCVGSRRRAGGKKRVAEAVPRADNFGDLRTADHKVLSDNCESRNNHRYAVVVQDLASQWIQAYPCKNKTSQETQRSLQKFLEPERKTKVIYTDNSLEFGKACEYLSWNHCTSTPHRSETNGIAERAVRRVQEGTSAVLLQSGLIESWWADSMECYTYLRNVTDYCLMGRLPMKDVLGNHLEDLLFHLVH